MQTVYKRKIGFEILSGIGIRIRFTKIWGSGTGIGNGIYQCSMYIIIAFRVQKCKHKTTPPGGEIISNISLKSAIFYGMWNRNRNHWNQ